MEQERRPEHDGDLYYLGSQDEGWARTSFQWLEIDPDLPAFDGINTDDDNYKDECWFYFKTNGKAVKMIRPNTTTRLIPSMSTEECLICGYILKMTPANLTLA